MDFKDKVKDVWEKTQDVAGNAYKTVADKSNKIVEEAKLKIKVSDTEAEISNVLQEIGILVYEKYKSGEALDKEILKNCKAVEKMYKEIEQLDTKYARYKTDEVMKDDGVKFSTLYVNGDYRIRVYINSDCGVNFLSFSYEYPKLATLAKQKAIDEL